MAFLNISLGSWISLVGVILFISLIMLSMWKVNRDDRREQGAIDELDDDQR